LHAEIESTRIKLEAEIEKTNAKLEHTRLELEAKIQQSKVDVIKWIIGWVTGLIIAQTGLILAFIKMSF
jgi:hypothetical protein